MFVRLLTIAGLFFGFLLMSCDLPQPPPGPENAFVALEFKNSREEITKNAMTDSTGKQVKIFLIHNLTQYIDSSVLKITNGTGYNESVPIRSFKAQVDTTIYPLVFTTAGTYYVSFTGYIVGQSTTLNGTITILDRSQLTRNQKPVLHLPKVDRVGVGQELVFPVSATDSNANQQVIINILKMPVNAIFSENQFKWTPALSDTGAVTIIFSATDNGSPVLIAIDSIKIIVASKPVNRAPMWNPSRIQRTIVPAQLFSLDLGPYCSDPDNDSLSFSLKSETPVKEAIVGKVYQFTPSVSDTGKHSTHIIATDPSKLVDTLTLELTISSSGSSTIDIVPPSIQFKSPSKDTIIGTDSCEIKVTCIDDSGCSVKGFRDGIAFDMKKSASVANLWSGVAKELTPASYSIIKIIATDSSAAKNMNSMSIRIKYDNDKTKPELKLVSPAPDSATISVATTIITIKVKDASGIAGVKCIMATDSFAVSNTDSLYFATITGLKPGAINEIIFIAVDKSVNANFDTLKVHVIYTTPLPNTYTVNYQANGSSSGTVPIDTNHYKSLAKVTVLGNTGAASKTGYNFAGWNTRDDGNGTTFAMGDTFTIMSSNVILYAKWIRIPTFELTVSTVNGSVTKFPDRIAYDSGSTVSLKATPNTGYKFTSWTGDAAGTNDTTTIVINSFKNAIANFTKISYSLTIKNDGHGTTYPSTDVLSVSYGTLTTIQATPAAGYKFTGWSVTSGTATITDSTAALTTVLLNSGNATLTAKFSLQQFTLTAIATTGGTIVAPVKSPITVNYGDSSAIIAVPSAGFLFSSWTHSNASGAIVNTVSSNTVAILKTGNDTITAHFAVDPNYTVTDIDGNAYHIVLIGNQVWMAENLKTTHYNDGTPIPLVSDGTAWTNLSTPGYCWHNDSIVYKTPYGALYNWYAANTSKLAPSGWHVASYQEWIDLFTYLGFDVAGGKLKETGTVHWKSPNTGATNEYGFTALPGSSRNQIGQFYTLGEGGMWWSATSMDATRSYFLLFAFDQAGASTGDVEYQTGCSVRCIRDQ